MTEETKTTLFYILALAGLIISSVLFTGRIESPAEAPSAPVLPTITKINSTLSLPEVDQKACPGMTQKTAFYRLEPGRLVDHRLVISGAVYASDFMTPVPDVLIEVWQAPVETLPPYPPETLLYAFSFRGWARTNAAGHYKVTILQPGPGNIPPLYYRVRYQNRCPLGLQLFLVNAELGLTDISLTSTLAKLGLAQGEPTGPLLQGSVDLVLPVPLPTLYPPLPEASRSVGVAPPKGMTWSQDYYAEDINLEAKRIPKQ
jgi:hypothetical protein